MKEHEQGHTNAIVETHTKGGFDCQMGHITPLVAQEAEKGCTIGM